MLVALWSFEFIRLPMLRYDKFGTFGFDLGIYDQGRGCSRGQGPVCHVRGLEFFGHHVNPFLLLFVPFYGWARDRSSCSSCRSWCRRAARSRSSCSPATCPRSKWAGVALAAALLLNPTYQWLTWEFFHPDALADRAAALRVLGGAHGAGGGSRSPRCSPSFARRTSRSPSR